ncbi:MAG: hypothetical protein AAF997_13135 [Myxococcota bacterium]
MSRAAIGIVALSLVHAAALAQGPSFEFEAPVETTLGDPIPVILTVTAPANVDAAVTEQSLAPFEVLEKKSKVEPSSDGSTNTFTFELTLQCFEVGTHELGPLKVRLTTRNGELDYLETSRKEIEVRSVLANEPNAELKPATQPVVVEQDDYTLLVVLGALLAILLGALAAWLFMRWWQRRDRPEPTPPPPPPPWETALAELRRLESTRANEISEGRTESWVDAVSDSIRVYLGRRFGFQGLESTTDEIVRALQHLPEGTLEPGAVVGFLGQCDLVKFARASLAGEASRDLILEAIALVDRTRPLGADTAGASA